MLRFTLPTEVHFGEGVLEERIERLVGGRRVLLVCGKRSARELGIVDAVRAFASSCQVFEGVRENPEISQVVEVANLIKDWDPECVVAAGGGSVMDLTKVAVCSADTGLPPIEVLRSGGKKCARKRGLGAIPTIAGSGSEADGVAVISVDSDRLKIPVRNRAFYPDWAVVDPSYNSSVPRERKVYNFVDVLVHYIDAYLSGGEIERGGELFLFTHVRTLMDTAGSFFSNERVGLFRVSWYSTLALSSVFSFVKGYFLLHELEHAMSALEPNLPHGLGLLLLFGPFVRVSVYEDGRDSLLGKLLFGTENLAEGMKSFVLQHVNNLPKVAYDVMELMKVLRGTLEFKGYEPSSPTFSPFFEKAARVYREVLEEWGS